MKNPQIWRRETSQSFNQNAAIGDFRDQPEREPDADRPPKLQIQFFKKFYKNNCYWRYRQFKQLGCKILAISRYM